jgi:hypothetical protein
MHWIFVGIMIWIGLSIAPAVLGLVIYAIPFVIFGFIGALVIGLTTQSAGGALLGGLIGGIAPYIIFKRGN